MPDPTDEELTKAAEDVVEIDRQFRIMFGNGRGDLVDYPSLKLAVAWLSGRYAVNADLLAACKTAAMACDVYKETPLIDEVLEHLRRAIAKAEGSV